MRKRVLALFILIVIIFTFTACGDSSKGKYAGEKTIGGLEVINDANSTIDESTGIGIRYTDTLKGLVENQFLMEAMAPPYAITLMTIPEKVQNNEITKLENEDLSAAEQEEIYKQIEKNTIYLSSVIRVEDGDTGAKGIFDGFTKSFEHRKEIGKIGKSTYYFGYNDNFDQFDLSENEKTQLAKAVKEIPEFEKSIYIFKPAKKNEASFEGMKIDDFKTTTINGDAITSEIFSQYRLTMVNTWATWCSPCVEEMPELAKLYQELPDGVNLLGICTDAEEQADMAKEIVKDSKATFTMIKPDDNLQNGFIRKVVTALPTTVFVDQEGRIVGEPIVGVPRDGDVVGYYKKEIEQRLKMLK